MSRWYRNAFNGYLSRIGNAATANSFTIPASSYDTVAQVDMGATGLGGDWEDVASFETDVDIDAVVPVWGFASVTLTSQATGGTTAAIRLVFDTTEEAGTPQQILLSSNTDKESLTCQIFAAPVSIGVKTIKMQWRRVSGGGSVELLRGSLFSQAQQVKAII